MAKRRSRARARAPTIPFRTLFQFNLDAPPPPPSAAAAVASVRAHEGGPGVVLDFLLQPAPDGGWGAASGSGDDAGDASTAPAEVPPPEDGAPAPLGGPEEGGRTLLERWWVRCEPAGEGAARRPLA